MLEYRSVQDLNHLIVKHLEKFDPDLDLIVGCPRSGMLPATLISLYLNLALCDLNGYLLGSPPVSSPRLPDRQQEFESDIPDRPRKVLIVDDSLVTGSSMSRIKEKIRQATNTSNDRIQYCAVYAHPERRSHVDLWLEAPESCVFEWNMMTHPTLTQACVEIDGVLCRYPTPEESDNGPQYNVFIETVEPLFRPVHKFGWIVTTRLEKYRWATVQWLKKHKIEFDFLVMQNEPPKDKHLIHEHHARFKADMYAETDSVLFIESSEQQASHIAKFSHKPVFCTKTRKMYYHTSPEVVKRRETKQRYFQEKVMAKLPESFRKKIMSFVVKRQG